MIVEKSTLFGRRGNDLLTAFCRLFTPSDFLSRILFESSSKAWLPVVPSYVAHGI